MILWDLVSLSGFQARVFVFKKQTNELDFYEGMPLGKNMMSIIFLNYKSYRCKLDIAIDR